MRSLLIAMSAVAALSSSLAACAPTEDGGAVSSPPLPKGTALPPPEMTDAPDQCRASAYQSYVGRNRSELPPKPENETWRVSCSTCAVTMDYNPRRLNIVYDSATNVVREVKCG
jgi:hypothetical protein